MVLNSLDTHYIAILFISVPLKLILNRENPGYLAPQQAWTLQTFTMGKQDLKNPFLLSKTAKSARLYLFLEQSPFTQKKKLTWSREPPAAFTKVTNLSEVISLSASAKIKAAYETNASDIMYMVVTENFVRLRNILLCPWKMHVFFGAQGDCICHGLCNEEAENYVITAYVMACVRSASSTTSL